VFFATEGVVSGCVWANDSFSSSASTPSLDITSQYLSVSSAPLYSCIPHNDQRTRLIVFSLAVQVPRLSDLQPPAVSPSYFIPVTVSENSQAGPDLAVLTLSIPSDSLPSDKLTSSLDPIWSIFIKDDDIQVERPYTPLFGIDEEGVIKLWVKRYPRGEVGRWLHSKQAGDTIEIRGPLKTFPFHQGKWDEVVMVCFPLTRRAHTFLNLVV
jgi:NADPH-dependent ferric siderophore reductase